MAKKKLAVIGRGTVGSMAPGHFLTWTDWDIDWYHYSAVKPQAVGEGSNSLVPVFLHENMRFVYTDLTNIDGTAKLGIYKENWGKGNNFTHGFGPPTIGYHFNAVRLQEWLHDHLKNEPRIRLLDQDIKDPNDVDADFVLDCSGFPKDFSEHHMSEYIPVNTCYVTQCFWPGVKFNNTLTIARPYGWVFGIPLQNRCSIGYLFNRDINSLDEVKEDVKEVFKRFELTPSDTTNYIEFKNFYRRQNFKGRLAHNGNSSFFLEPLEATSLTFAESVIRNSYDLWLGNITEAQANEKYLNYIQEIETVIMMHYLAGSIFDTEFWRFARERAERCVRKEFNRSVTFSHFIERSRNLPNKGGYDHLDRTWEYGTWFSPSFYQNLTGLDLYPALDNLK